MMSAMRTLGASAIAERFCLLIVFAVKERHRHRVKILYLPSTDERVAYRGYTMRQKLAQLIFSCRRRYLMTGFLKLCNLLPASTMRLNLER